MDEVLSRISSDPVIREAVTAQLGLTTTSSEHGVITHVTDVNTPTTSLQRVVSSQLASSSQSVVHTSSSVLAISVSTIETSQSGDESPLVARVHQVGASMKDHLAVRCTRVWLMIH